MIQQLINNEMFTNIQKAQSGLTRLFMEAKKKLGFYRVMRNNESLGVLLPEDLWRSITEDIEALSSRNFLRKVSASRKGKRYSAAEVKKIAGS